MVKTGLPPTRTWARSNEVFAVIATDREVRTSDHINQNNAFSFGGSPTSELISNISAPYHLQRSLLPPSTQEGEANPLSSLGVQEKSILVWTQKAKTSVTCMHRPSLCDHLMDAGKARLTVHSRSNLWSAAQGQAPPPKKDAKSISGSSKRCFRKRRRQQQECARNASKMRQNGSCFIRGTFKNASKMRGTPLGENTFWTIPSIG